VDKNLVQDSRIVALERVVNSARALGVEAHGDHVQGNEPLDWSKWPVALNQLHPSIADLREALRRAHIPLSELFGEEKDGLPSRWIVSLSNQLPITHKVAILRAVVPFGFDGFQFWDPV